MFYVLSKVVYFLISPSHLCLIALASGTILAAWPKRQRISWILIVASLAGFVVLGFSPLGYWAHSRLLRYAPYPLATGPGGRHRRFAATQKWFLDVDKCESACGCPACNGVRNLKIKFILHGGRVGFYRIANFKQIVGLDVIIVHRLLKNSVPSDEYQLISADLMAHTDISEDAAGWIKNQDTYPVIGTIPYYYKELKRNPDSETLDPPYKEPIS